MSVWSRRCQRHEIKNYLREHVVEILSSFSKRLSSDKHEHYGADLLFSVYQFVLIFEFDDCRLHQAFEPNPTPLVS